MTGAINCLEFKITTAWLIPLTRNESESRFTVLNADRLKGAAPVVGEKTVESVSGRGG